MSFLVSTSAEPRVERVSLFKNGVAVIRVQAAVPAEGPVQLAKAPEPVMGTFSVLSDEPVQARLRMVEKPISFTDFSQLQLLAELGGEKVAVSLKSGGLIRGKVLAPSRVSEISADKNYATVDTARRSWWGWYGNDVNLSGYPAGNPLIYLEVPENGLVAVKADQIEEIRFPKAPNPTKETPVFELQSQGKATNASIEYLAKGISWVPSYRLDLGNDGKMRLRQKAVIRNELSDLSNVEIRLISGFPSIKFAGVDSPLSANTNWAQYFQRIVELNDPNRSSNSSAVLNRVYTQVGHGGLDSSSWGGSAPPQMPAGDEGSVDLHYENVGLHDLAKGEALALQVAEAETEFEQLVDWKVPDNRNEDGRRINEHERRRYPEKYDPSPWDAVLFKNPFEFPLTTAPATVIRGGDFQGQQRIVWTNPNEETLVRINKALSISTTYSEFENEEAREEVRVFGQRHYRTQVTGELSMTNYRQSPVTLRVRREFSGKLLRADEEPDARLLEKGVYNVNPRRRLTWKLDLKPGETQQLKYDYQVLVRN